MENVEKEIQIRSSIELLLSQQTQCGTRTFVENQQTKFLSTSKSAQFCFNSVATLLFENEWFQDKIISTEKCRRRGYLHLTIMQHTAFFLNMSWCVELQFYLWLHLVVVNSNNNTLMRSYTTQLTLDIIARHLRNTFPRLYFSFLCVITYLMICIYIWWWPT